MKELKKYLPVPETMEEIFRIKHCSSETNDNIFNDQCVAEN